MVFVEILGASGWSTAALCATLITLGLVNARKVCSFIGEWLVYLIVVKPFLHRKNVQDHGKPSSTSAMDQEYKKDLQVIICGLQRTGTMSMMLAMEILGFPCFHGFHLCKPTTHNLFMKALEYGKKEDWKVLLVGYASIADFPGAYAYKTLMEMYPNAKVILTIRDPNEWYRSFSQTIMNTVDTYSHLPYSICRPYYYEVYERFCYKIMLRGKPHDRESCIESFNQHIQDVKAYVDPHKLLIYEVGKHDDWTLLCDFLNVMKPSMPFPSSNNRESFQSINKRTQMLRTIVILSYFIALILTTSLLAICCNYV